MAKFPRIFISYAWEEDGGEHRHWVRSLATRLMKEDLDIRADLFRDNPRQSISDFMTTELRLADVVVVVCTPLYQEKVHAKQEGLAMSGVGWEAGLIAASLLEAEGKVIVPVLAKASWKESVPFFLRDFFKFDLTCSDKFVECFQELAAYLLSIRPLSAPMAPPHPQPANPTWADLRPYLASGEAVGPDMKAGDWWAWHAARHHRLAQG